MSKIQSITALALAARAHDAIDDAEPAPAPERTSWSGTRPTRLY